MKFRVTKRNEKHNCRKKTAADEFKIENNLKVSHSNELYRESEFSFFCIHFEMFFRFPFNFCCESWK